MKRIADLKLGFADAENYKRRENKDLLNRLFIRNEFLDQLCQPAISFLLGEKGTGKTAYSVYLTNNHYKGHFAKLKFIRETEYQKFVVLKREKQLVLSDYTSIWKVILCLLLAQQVYDREGKNGVFSRFTTFAAVHRAIQDYYAHAFSPEIAMAMEIVRESKVAAEILSNYASIGGEESENIKFTESKFQINLFYILKKLQDALRELRLDNNHILFIDGIDIRPSNIPFPEYLECIKGLANAVWELNNDFFPAIKGSKGRMRVVLLIRPDIFDSLGLQNQNTKLRDNSVFLDWRTEYKSHRTSNLFKVIDHILEFQQDERKKLGVAWDYYFPWEERNQRDQKSFRSSFVEFLRWSYYRPRDIITALGLLQKEVLERDENCEVILSDDFLSKSFARDYSNYLLGEVKDHLLFYYTQHEYDLFLKFFEFLDGQNHFNYSTYINAYEKLMDYIKTIKDPMPQFMATANDFLQFLYDLNVLCYIDSANDGEKFIHWCFRDRNYSNISPKVKADCDYEIFYGLAKALNVGKKLANNGQRPRKS